MQSDIIGIEEKTCWASHTGCLLIFADTQTKPNKHWLQYTHQPLTLSSQLAIKHRIPVRCPCMTPTTYVWIQCWRDFNTQTWPEMFFLHYNVISVYFSSKHSRWGWIPGHKTRQVWLFAEDSQLHRLQFVQQAFAKLPEQLPRQCIVVNYKWMGMYCDRMNGGKSLHNYPSVNTPPRF